MLNELARIPPMVVALGASAGGLAALQEFFQALPERCQSLAFVVVQHLAPDYQSVLSELLQRSTSLIVSVASGGMRLGPGTVKELGRALEEGYRLLFEDFCPAAILVDRSGQVLHVFVNADRFLKFPAGAVLLGLTDLLSPKLAVVASAALSRVFRNGVSGKDGDYPEIVVQEDGGEPPVGLRIRPFLNQRGGREFALVTIRMIDRADLPAGLVTLAEFDLDAQQHILTLRQELQQMRTNFQATVEELETTNEELQATNEEFQSTSQEYQATAEQLRLELKAASQQFLELNHQSEQTAEDLRAELANYQAYLEAAQPAVLFLDSELCVVLATRGVKSYLPVLERDVGRPVEHIASSFAQEPFLKGARQVLELSQPFADIWPLKESDQFVSILMRPFGETGVSVNFSQPVLPTGQLLSVIQQPAALVNRAGRLLASNQPWDQLPQAARTALGEALENWRGEAQLDLHWTAPAGDQISLQLGLQPVVQGQAVHLVTTRESASPLAH